MVLYSSYCRCSTLQRNKQGTWTIQVKPNQSGMSDMAPEDDEEIIDIINEDGGRGDMKFMPSPEHKRINSSKIDRASTMKDARKAFFEGESSDLDVNRSPYVQYVMSPPNPTIQQKPKPKVAPKPAHVIERAASMRRQPVPNQPSRASLRSSGQNSSEDRDSDSTIKGSVVTLKPDDTQKNSPYNSKNSAKASPTKVGTDSNQKNIGTKPTTLPEKKRRDRSSGSSDGGWFASVHFM